jgi:FtsH-binding integral membrane protein
MASSYLDLRLLAFRLFVVFVASFLAVGATSAFKSYWKVKNRAGIVHALAQFVLWLGLATAAITRNWPFSTILIVIGLAVMGLTTRAIAKSESQTLQEGPNPDTRNGDPGGT